MALPNGYNSPPSWMYLEGISAGIGEAGTIYYVDGNAGNDSYDGI